MHPKLPVRIALMLPLALLNIGAGDPTNDELTLLQDPAGWEYLSMSDVDAGIQTEHTCFDGRPHPENCSGTLTLTPSNTFAQSVHIHGETVQRHGTYELSGDQLTFTDELGTKDGPYSFTIDSQSKRLVLQMPQVRIELELERQYKEDLKKSQKTEPRSQ